jgi:ketosteroid isomerase-like protein
VKDLSAIIWRNRRHYKLFFFILGGGGLKTLEALLLPTYTHTDVFGALNDRASWLPYAAGRAGRSTQISFRDVEIRRIGDTAIVTGINDVTGSGGRNPEDQKPLSLRFTQVWMLREWRMAAVLYHYHDRGQ